MKNNNLLPLKVIGVASIVFLGLGILDIFANEGKANVLISVLPVIAFWLGLFVGKS